MSDPLAAFRWRDALDILLVAIVIYRVFVMFRGTRAVQMMIGLGALAAASLLARQLELYSTVWLLDNFWSFWVIALVVLFQPELRRVLASLGQGRVGQALLGASREERAQVTDEIANAVESLSGRRIGALLVIERATGLRQYAELGVPLDAQVSADLLVSVFLPYSPLHDGAVFLQGTRIAAAGCFLRSRATSRWAGRSARDTGRRSGSPRRPTRSRSSSPRRPGASRSRSRARWTLPWRWEASGRVCSR